MEIFWQVLPARGAFGEAVVLWNEDTLKCNEVINEVSISSQFENSKNGWKWLFTWIYSRREGRERPMLWTDIRFQLAAQTGWVTIQ